MSTTSTEPQSNQAIVMNTTSTDPQSNQAMNTTSTHPQYNSLLGIRGNSESSIGGTLASLSIFNKFLETMEICTVNESLCSRELLSQFGDYLINFAVNQTTGGRLMPSTIVQYTSSVVNELAHRFPGNPLFKDFKTETGMKWFKDLSKAVNNRAVDRCIVRHHSLYG